MKVNSLDLYLKKVHKFIYNYKKVHIIHFIVGVSLFLVTLILSLIKFKDFGTHFVSSFQQLGNLIHSNIIVVISLILCYFFILYFVIFAIISVARKDRTKFWPCDIAASVVAIILGIVFIHGTESINILNIFSVGLKEIRAGNAANGARYLAIFFSCVFSLLMLIVYSLDRLIIRIRKIGIILSVKEYPYGLKRYEVDHVHEPVRYSFAYHKISNYIRIMDNIKVVNIDTLNAEVHKLLIKANEQNSFCSPRFLVKVKCGFDIYEKELILNKDLSFGVNNGHLYIKEISKDILS